MTKLDKKRLSLLICIFLFVLFTPMGVVIGWFGNWWLQISQAEQIHEYADFKFCDNTLRSPAELQNIYRW